MAGWPRLSERVAQVGSLWSLPVCAAQEALSRSHSVVHASSGYRRPGRVQSFMACHPTTPLPTTEE